jgi:acetyl-CoA carboxylase carboxyltransferase component
VRERARRSIAEIPLSLSRDSADINRLFGAGPQDEYDMRQIIACIVDGSEFTEYKAEYGQTLLTGYARVGGFAVGIVANQRMHVREKGKAI